MAKVKDIQKIYESSILQLNEKEIDRYKKATAKLNKRWHSFYRDYMKTLGSWIDNKPGYEALQKSREKTFNNLKDMDCSIEKHDQALKMILNKCEEKK